MNIKLNIIIFFGICLLLKVATSHSQDKSLISMDLIEEQVGDSLCLPCWNDSIKTITEKVSADLSRAEVIIVDMEMRTREARRNNDTIGNAVRRYRERGAVIDTIVTRQDVNVKFERVR